YMKEQPAVPHLLRMFNKICEAVAFANSRGVIHRDLKPENIMVGAFGEVLVMDWGIAKTLSEASKSEKDDLQSASQTVELSDNETQNLTADGTVMGTKYYMSPEQAGGHSDQVDQRADVYSLGAILYFLLTARHPDKFQKRPDSDESMNANSEAPTKKIKSELIDEQAVLRPRKVNRGIHKALDAICAKAMSERPENRYSNAIEIGNDITSFLDGQPVTAYRENLFEQASRWIGNNRFVFILILTYIVMRFFIFLLVRR
ncbi:MAG TPA: serine/threonine-protein kinase, partial [Blastocatellia bacterium]|nr:serine/threonine-protein kinase [Blastocatellia bacterium]